MNIFTSMNDFPLRRLYRDKVKLLEWVYNAGYEAVEMGCGSLRSAEGINPYEISKYEISKIKDALKMFKKADFHAQCYNMNDLTLLSPHELVRHAFREELRAVCAIAEKLNIDTITIHCGSTRANINEEQAQGILAEELKKINKIAVDHGVRFAIEVCDYLQPADRYELFPEILELDGLGINLDTGHMTLPGGAGDAKLFPFDGPAYEPYGSIEGFIKKYGNNIIHVHIHDYDPDKYPRQCGHRPIGTGIINFDAVICALIDVNFSGSLSSELCRLDLDTIRNESQVIKRLISKGGRKIR